MNSDECSIASSPNCKAIRRDDGLLFLLPAAYCLIPIQPLPFHADLRYQPPSDASGRGGIGRRAALRSLFPNRSGSSSLLDRTIGIPKVLKSKRSPLRGSITSTLRSTFSFA